jgi:TolA-binding protein
MHRALPLPRLLLLVAFGLGFFFAAPAESMAQVKGINAKLYRKYLLMQDKTKHLMLSGKYEESLKLFAQVIKGLEPVEHINRTYARAVEFCYYHSAVANLELKRYDPALDWFARYLSKYPRGMHRNVSIILSADILAVKGLWDQVIRLVDPLASNLNLGARLLTAAHELRAEAYFQLKQYVKAGGSAKYLYDNVADTQVRTDAATMFAICLVRLKRYKALYTFLPNILHSQVRYDAGLNRALIDEGDREYNGNDYANALLLYRLVYPKVMLEAKMAERIVDVERYRDNIAETSSLTAARNASAIKRKIKRLLAKLAKDQEKLHKMPDYDQELAMREASSYFALHRLREAIAAFWGVYHDFPDHPLADQALYATFTTAYTMGDIDRSIKEGYAYLRIFPKGKFYEILSLNLAQIHYQRGEHQACVDLARKALALRPNHGSADQLRYLIGYNLFQMEQLSEAEPAFAEVREKHPESQVAESAAYWQAMCQLYDGRYPEAEASFTAFVAQYLGGMFYSDALYRRAICQYGNADFHGAAATLESFVERFPEQPSKPEALTMLGDIYASDAELDRALAQYEAAVDCAVTMVQVNRATFQIAKMYRLEERWEETLMLFNQYLHKWKSEGNFTEAIYWTGTSLQRLDRSEEALDIFFNAIIQYGDVPAHHGIDMILRDLIGELKVSKEGSELYAFKDKLYAEVLTARESHRTTLYLRLITFFYHLVDDPATRRKMIDAVTKREHIRFAGPLTLNLMGEQALVRNDHELARQAFAHFLEHHGESELAVTALKTMAQIHIAEGKLDEAETMLDELAARFASLPEAGWAALKQAELHRRRGDYALAMAGFKQVVAVKQWRGPYWAEALYSMGLCLADQKQYREAFAYYQRVYVMYEAYDEWSAKAYIQSARSLLQLGMKGDARKTCRELLAHPVLSKRPEAVEAQGLLQEIGGGS